ncbi:MAG: biopolymer transporter ExbD [Bacteroidota bacterium]
MKTNRRYSPSVNAGSMADIAFLLLIFFLVTTTISADKGILRKLPKPCPPGQICSTEIEEQNLLRILVNQNGEIMINDQQVNLDEVKEYAKRFLDNNGQKRCDYCNGEQSLDASDHPTEAVISLQTDALVKYDLFIKVQDELTLAYYELRQDYAQLKYGKSAESLIKSELDEVKAAYPFILSEAQIVR